MSRVQKAALYLLAFFATWHVVRFYIYNAQFYLDWTHYFAGTERMPFQARVLPALIIAPLLHIGPLRHALGGHNGPMSDPATEILFFLDMAALAATGWFAHRLYRLFSPSGRFAVAVYPVLLAAFLFSYAVHFEQNLSYPYDALSLLFFTAGLVCIAEGRFALLLLVMLLGTLNRETTLFLVVIFILDHLYARAVRRPGVHGFAPFALRVAVLVLAWGAVYFALQHHFALNDHSEAITHVQDNLRALKPNQWPALLNICAYLPLVLALAHRRLPQRFVAWLWVLPLWIGLMFFSGLLIETRIYGELCGYSAAGTALLLDGLWSTERTPHQ